MRVYSAVLAAVAWLPALAGSGAASAQGQPGANADLPTLKPGETTTGEIAGGQERVYGLALKAGQYVQVLVEQKGVDLVVRADTPEGRRGEEIDFRLTTDGIERLTLVAEIDGVYRIALWPRAPNAASGGYAVTLEAPRPATSRDRAIVRADGLFAEGHALWREGSAPSRERATARLQEAAVAYREAEIPGLVARSLGDAGVVEWQLGHMAEALELYRQSLPLRRAAGDRRGEAMTLSNMGLVHRTQGRIRDALQAFTEAIAIWREIGDRQGQSLTLHNLAVTRIFLSDYQPALEALRSALVLSRESRSKPNEALVLGALGALYSALGETDQARGPLLEAQAAYRVLGDRRAEGQFLLELGFLHHKTGRLAEAVAVYEESARLLKASGDALSESVARARLGDAYLAQGRREPAAREFDAARDLARRSGNANNEAGALVMLALVRSMEGRPVEARRLLDQARPLVESAGPTSGAAFQRHVMGDVLRRLGELEEARRQTAIAVELVDAARGGMAAPDLRATYLASVHRFYERHADILMRLHQRDPLAGHAAAALETIEKGRARTLVELLTEGQRTIHDDLPPELLQREQDVHALITALQRRLLDRSSATPEARAERAGLARELESAERQRQEVEEEVRRANPRYASIRYPQAPSVAAIQALLDPDSALVEYSLGEAPYVFVVTREGIATRRLASESTIGAEVARLREAVSLPSRTRRSAYLGSSRRLYDLLLAPVGAVLRGKRRLIVVPDRVLAYLPFEALLLRDVAPGTPDARLPYLVRRWTVAYVPSAGTLASLRQRREAAAPAGPARKDVVAFADPAGWSTQEDPPAGANSESPLRGVLEDLGLVALKPLPDSRREAEELQRTLGAGNVAVYVGPSATEEAVKGSPEVSTARRLHFATHALVSARRPNHSALVLSRVAGGREDGLLQAFEIFDLRLQADLVVLSACQTGLGQELRGEGVIGLTRAFLYAGANRVAATLWEVADRSTAELMADFYRQMESTPGTGDALRQAKLQMIAGGRFAHPYYWAPFVLVGEP